MTPEQIRQVVRDEIRRNDSSSRFGLNMVSHHTHSGGNDGQQINANDIIPSVSVSGNINFAQATTYTLNLNASFTPSRIQLYGNVTGDSHQLFFITGSANLGPSFFFQPLTNTSVRTGSVQYPTMDSNEQAVIPLQSNAYYGTEDSGNRGNSSPATTPGAFHTASGEQHIVRVRYTVANGGGSATTFASMTVTSFSKTSIQLKVDTLATGWEINANIIVT